MILEVKKKHPNPMTSANFDTPILIIFFHRVDVVAKVIESLRDLAPSKLFLACDGPRQSDDEECTKVLQTRNLVEQLIDWPCSIEKRYSDSNQGTKYGPANAITWFFSQVDEGIILEHDCLPHPSFFPYCQSLLSRYRHDTRVWQISGNNFLAGQAPTESSYFFSGYTLTWGWATWRRCWQAYDIDMKLWPQIRESGQLVNAFEGEDELKYWTRIWDRLTQDNYPVTWDYQWNFACFSNGGLCAIPRVNLVSNIGFGEGATYCLSGDDPHADVKSSDLNDLSHPLLVLREWSQDCAIFNDFVNNWKPKPSPIQELVLKIFYTARGAANRIGFIR
jgi:hypothetical protein